MKAQGFYHYLQGSGKPDTTSPETWSEVYQYMLCENEWQPALDGGRTIAQNRHR
jgi:hypothetical protein